MQVEGRGRRQNALQQKRRVEEHGVGIGEQRLPAGRRGVDERDFSGGERRRRDAPPRPVRDLGVAEHEPLRAHDLGEQRQREEDERRRSSKGARVARTLKSVYRGCDHGRSLHARPSRTHCGRRRRSLVASSLAPRGRRLRVSDRLFPRRLHPVGEPERAVPLPGRDLHGGMEHLLDRPGDRGPRRSGGQVRLEWTLLLEQGPGPRVRGVSGLPRAAPRAPDAELRDREHDLLADAAAHGLADLRLRAVALLAAGGGDRHGALGRSARDARRGHGDDVSLLRALLLQPRVDGRSPLPVLGPDPRRRSLRGAAAAPRRGRSGPARGARGHLGIHRRADRCAPRAARRGRPVPEPGHGVRPGGPGSARRAAGLQRRLLRLAADAVLGPGGRPELCAARPGGELRVPVSVSEVRGVLPLSPRARRAGVFAVSAVGNSGRGAMVAVEGAPRGLVVLRRRHRGSARRDGGLPQLARRVGPRQPVSGSGGVSRRDARLLRARLRSVARPVPRGDDVFRSPTTSS